MSESQTDTVDTTSDTAVGDGTPDVEENGPVDADAPVRKLLMSSRRPRRRPTPSPARMRLTRMRLTRMRLTRMRLTRMRLTRMRLTRCGRRGCRERSCR